MFDEMKMLLVFAGITGSILLGVFMWLRRPYPWIRYILIPFVLLWMGYYGTMLVWVSTPRTILGKDLINHHEQLFTLANKSPVTVPLRELTWFEWSAMCFFSGYPAFDSTDLNNIEEALGPHGPTLAQDLAGLGLDEVDTTYLFKTPDGIRQVDFYWWFFSKNEHHRLMTRYYAERLNHKGVEIKLSVKPKPRHWNKWCYTPDEVMVEVKPET